MTTNKKNLSLKQMTSLEVTSQSEIIKGVQIKSPISRYGVGFDVHKRKIAVCVAAQLANGDIITVKEHVFSAVPAGIDEICKFILKYTPVSHYLMECTGVYHLPLYHSLRAIIKKSEKVIAMNPLLVNRRITELGSKTDKADARSLAYLTFYSSLLKPSYIGTMEFFRLRDTIRRYHNSVIQCTRFKNRITRLLHTANIKDVFDLSREWALILLDRLISKDQTLGEAYQALIEEYESAGMGTGVLQKQEFNIRPFSDISLSGDEQFALKMELGRLLHEQIVAVSFLRKAERQVIEMSTTFENYKKLMLIPGLGAVGALTILLELGDYTRFENASAFAKFCGTAPQIYNSGEHVSRGHLNRFSNKYIRTALVNAAGPIVNRCGKETDLGEYAHRQIFIRHLPYKRALIKVANKLAKTIYHVLVDNVEFDPNYELKHKRIAELTKRMAKKNSLLSSIKTRALRRDINNFIATNYEYLNSSARFLLCTGMHKMLERANFINDPEHNEVRKKKK